MAHPAPVSLSVAPMPGSSFAATAACASAPFASSTPGGSTVRRAARLALFTSATAALDQRDRAPRVPWRGAPPRRERVRPAERVRAAGIRDRATSQRGRAAGDGRAQLHRQFQSPGWRIGTSAAASAHASARRRRWRVHGQRKVARRRARRCRQAQAADGRKLWTRRPRCSGQRRATAGTPADRPARGRRVRASTRAASCRCRDGSSRARTTRPARRRAARRQVQAALRSARRNARSKSSGRNLGLLQHRFRDRCDKDRGCRATHLAGVRRYHRAGAGGVAGDANIDGNRRAGP